MGVIHYVLVLAVSQIATSAYTESMFRTALADVSTAPEYVLVTIEDGRTKCSRQVCIVAPFLEGAVNEEYKLGYGAAGRSIEMKRILAQRDRFFVFYSPRALKNVEPLYTEKQLSKVRGILSFKTNDQLTARFVGSLRDQLSREDPQPESSMAYRDAIAHALLERGILCGHGDVTDDIYILGQKQR